MNNTDRQKDHSLVPDCNPSNDLGLQERELLMLLNGPQERLAYSTEPLEMSNGCIVERYVIPEEDKRDVLERLYPFIDTPSLDDTMTDLHTEKTFKVRDFIVVREGDGNFLATPYYAEAGGTVLDWIDPCESGCCRTVKASPRVGMASN